MLVVPHLSQAPPPLETQTSWAKLLQTEVAMSERNAAYAEGSELAGLGAPEDESAVCESPSTYGSFRDSLRAPVHRWFTYPAGYSHKLVAAKLNQFKLTEGDWIADPFLGTGTTSLVAKESGLNSLGIEAHPFVFWVAQTKMHLDYNLDQLNKDVHRVLEAANIIQRSGFNCEAEWPQLIYKCFETNTLNDLYALRQAILTLDTDPHRRDFLRMALTATLRIVTSAGAGWPYIAPSKHSKRTVVRNAFEEFNKRCNLMVSDVVSLAMRCTTQSEHRLVNGDARSLTEYTECESIDLILTSPPYLNNYDYADRTRLETYFWGLYDSWGQITREVRDHLIIAATTQIRRTAMQGVRWYPGVKAVSPTIQSELVGLSEELSELRMVKGGKKAYDLLVAGYFEDMLKVIQGAYAVLKPGSSFILVLGDSAPYGVHVRTDELVGELAVAAGFSTYDLEVIRKRGEKWANNSQRHKVPLRESIVTIQK